MAISTFTYCSTSDVKQVYAKIDEFDNKTPIYNWSSVFSHGGYNLYESNNSGQVSQLFLDGLNLGGSNATATFTDSTTNTAEALDRVETDVDVGDGSLFSRGDYIKIDNEIMLVTGISSNTLTVRRGWSATTAVSHNTSADVYIGTSFTHNNDWYYDENTDVILVYVVSTLDPNDHTTEAGYDWLTYLTDQIEASSNQLNSMLDHSRFPIPIPKSIMFDASGSGSGTPEYDYIIKRLTALLTAYNCITAHNPLSEEAEAINVQFQRLLDDLNAGKITLDFETDRGDSTQGKIIEVVKTGSMHLVEAVCHEGFYGEPYDKIEILCTTQGAYGVAKVTVKYFGSDKLKGSEITEKIITGGLQAIHAGLYCRFEGDTLAINDKFEIEVRNRNLKTTSGGLKSLDIYRGKRWRNEV